MRARTLRMILLGSDGIIAAVCIRVNENHGENVMRVEPD